LRYIPNTIEIQKYTSFPKEFTTPIILWVRSFSKIYNPLMAVKVFIKIMAIFPEANICIVGPKKDDCYAKILQFAKKK
jgi:glycosyltransferase involved in cell wall biosynthesis